jgi:phospholipid-binding lipoprotein MlaA
MKNPENSASLAHRLVRAAAVSAAALLMAGCASMPNYNPRDPLEAYNRHAMTFNEGVDSVVLKPVATVYKNAVPPIVRTGVSNFFGNLGDAWSFVNSLLQFRLQDAEENLARFQINTMFGLGGILDVASELNIERHREDFGQTLGRWGMPAGPFIVLPFLGPSTLRDTLALPIDLKADLIRQMPTGAERDALAVLRAVDARSNLLRVGNVIEEAALDKYSFTREAYLQKRRAEVFEYKKSESDTDGAEPKADGTPATSGGQPAPAPAR